MDESEAVADLKPVVEHRVASDFIPPAVLDQRDAVLHRVPEVRSLERGRGREGSLDKREGGVDVHGE